VIVSSRLANSAAWMCRKVLVAMASSRCACTVLSDQFLQAEKRRGFRAEFGAVCSVGGVAAIDRDARGAAVAQCAAAREAELRSMRQEDDE
jgi:hypothetical protein